MKNTKITLATLNSAKIHCPHCSARGKASSGGAVEEAGGNMTTYKYRCRECGETWGVNEYYRGRYD